MKIKSMTATFGGLDRDTLEPGPGLTLIYAPNEGGKSTWAAFWRTMLYGIDTRDRDKKGYLADKNRYAPWTGAPMEGEITLEWQGQDITIRRGPRGSTPFGAFSAVYVGTQEPVPGLTASVCGELLTGVGQEVFTRSAFLGAGNLALTSVAELERRIAALVTSGEEDVSFSQAMERMKEWKNRRQVNKSVGEIPRLEGELIRAEESIGRLEEISSRISQLEERQNALEEERERLSRQAEAHKAIAQRKLAERCAQAEEDCRTAQERYTALQRELSRFGQLPDRERVKNAQGELQYLRVLEEEIKQGQEVLPQAEEKAVKTGAAAKDARFSEQTGDEAVAKAAEIAAAIQADREKLDRRKRMTGPLTVIGLVLAGLVGGGGWLASRNIVFAAVLAFIICAGTVCNLVLSHLGIRAAERRIAALLAPFGVQTAQELSNLAQNYRERCQEAEEAERQRQALCAALADRQTRRETAKADLLDFVHTFAPEVKDMFGCSAALSRALSLEHELAIARERVEERRRRLDDLYAQGAKPAKGLGGDLPAPAMSPEEIARALTQTAIQLEGEKAQLNQARGSRQAMGDPAALSARREQLADTLARRRLEFDGLTVAMDALTQANAQLQERFSPALNALASQYLARLTGGKYSAVSLTRELEGFVREERGVLPRSALALSRGTVDQLYLAVRLAVCQLCLPEKPPILLDDALTAFDDVRLRQALELLQEMAEEQQILLFTCQEREKAVLANRPNVKTIAL